eukprot:8291308-Pyramimonas_sp.AAC.2
MESFCVVVKTRVGQHRLVLGAEVDATMEQAPRRQQVRPPTCVVVKTRVGQHRLVHGAEVNSNPSTMEQYVELKTTRLMDTPMQVCHDSSFSVKTTRLMDTPMQ